MPGIHDQDPGGNMGLLEIALHQAAPAFLLRLGDLGVTVARQVHQVGPAVHQEIIYLGGFTRGRAHVGQVLPAQKAVDHRGLAHIGTARKGKLRQAVPKELFLCPSGTDKLRFSKIDRHSASFTAAGRLPLSPGARGQKLASPPGRPPAWAPAPQQTPGRWSPPG